METIAIVGFGRFGKTLYRLLKDDFKIVLFNRRQAAFDNIPLTKETCVAKNIKEIYQKSQTIFFAVPISSFEEVIKLHKSHFKNHLLIDVLSVKEYPAKVFKKYLEKNNTQAILTHPMFGPDSSKEGFNDLPLIMNQFMAKSATFNFWKKYFENKGLKVIEMSAKKHDQLAANSQGLTHFIGRLLNDFKFKPTTVDSLGAKKLNEIMDQTCNDTWELFLDLQNFNRFTKKMRIKLGRSYDKIYNQLLPARVNMKLIIYGIQGGVGSFNEEAILHYVQKNHIDKFKIKYLFTTDKVLKNLHEGNIDYGLFAIQNAVGGVVQESTYAMSKYKFKIVDEFDILVRHFLMKRKDTLLENIKTIMAHPQVFKQCQETLSSNYSLYNLISGQGDLIDTARAAWALAHNKVDKNTLILGPSILSKIYDFNIVAPDLQDNKNNLTTFFLVKR